MHCMMWPAMPCPAAWWPPLAPEGVPAVAQWLQPGRRARHGAAVRVPARAPRARGAAERVRGGLRPPAAAARQGRGCAALAERQRRASGGRAAERPRARHAGAPGSAAAAAGRAQCATRRAGPCQNRRGWVVSACRQAYLMDGMMLAMRCWDCWCCRRSQVHVVHAEL